MRADEPGGAGDESERLHDAAPRVRASCRIVGETNGSRRLQEREQLSDAAAVGSAHHRVMQHHADRRCSPPPRPRSRPPISAGSMRTPSRSRIQSTGDRQLEDAAHAQRLGARLARQDLDPRVGAARAVSAVQRFHGGVKIESGSTSNRSRSMRCPVDDVVELLLVGARDAELALAARLLVVLVGEAVLVDTHEPGAVRRRRSSAAASSGVTARGITARSIGAAAASKTSSSAVQAVVPPARVVVAEEERHRPRRSRERASHRLQPSTHAAPRRRVAASSVRIAQLRAAPSSCRPGGRGSSRSTRSRPRRARPVRATTRRARAPRRAVRAAPRAVSARPRRPRRTARRVPARRVRSRSSAVL